jgi:outer membrane protein TolC
MRQHGRRLTRVLAVACGVLLGCAAVASGQGPTAPVARLLPPQEAPPPTLGPPQEDPLPAPATAAQPTEDAVTVWYRDALPVNLPSALRLSQTNNLDIAQAREVVAVAGVALERARLAYIPTLNLGSAFSTHDGNIQKTEGNIIKANKDALFLGGGPSLTVSVADALFAPLVARQVSAASQAGSRRVANDILLAVADTYFAILRARRRLARVEETLGHLLSDQAAASRAGSKGLLPVVQSIQMAGGAEATKAEVERVRVEVLRRQEEKAAALQDFRVAMAELARLLRLDPRVPLWPVEDFRTPLPLPGAAWEEVPVEDLVRAALNNRPELAENQALVQAAVERVRNAQCRPLLPNLVLNYGYGDFGGGPDLNAPKITPATKTSPAKVTAVPGFGPGRQIHHFAPRSDFDVALTWKLQNMGLGDLANVREQEARLRQAQFAQTQAQDVVATQTVQAQELVKGSGQRLGVTRQALFDAAGAPTGPVFQALRLNFDRIRTVPNARPLEVLDAIRGLNDTLEAYGQAVTDCERARFRLLIVLGLPAPEVVAAVGAANSPPGPP